MPNILSSTVSSLSTVAASLALNIRR